MGHLSWGDVVAILGSLASIFGGVRLLLSFYFKQQVKLDASRKLAFTAQMELLRMDIEKLRIENSEIKSVVRQVKLDIQLFQRKVEDMIKGYGDSRESLDKVLKALREFVVETKQKFRKYDEQYSAVVVKAEEKPDAGKVEVKETPPPVFGKVKVRD
jgi:hypothetical protein